MGLLVMDNSFNNQLWLKCTQDKCTLDECLGKKLRENDRDQCPYSFFTLHKLSNKNGIVRVGDEIVLEHKSILGEDGSSMFNRSMYVSCDSNTESCAISSNCSMDDDFNNNTFCQENILIVRAVGKRDGEAITHRDKIGLEFRLLQDHGFFDYQCAFGCDPQTKQCKKDRCLANPINFLSTGAGEAGLSCRKDMFMIQKV